MTVRGFLVFGLVLWLSFSKAQTLNYYYGNLHSHTGYSDGSKDSATSGVSKPAGAYAYAKLSTNFDFLGIAEHNHYSSGSPGMKLANYASGLSQAAAANVPGTFLAMYGMEWGVSSTGNGHVVIFGFNQLIGWEPGNYNIYNSKTKYDSLFYLVKNNPNAFATLAHPYYTDFNTVAGFYSAASDSAIVGTPFRNGNALVANANYTTYALSDYVGYYKVMLKRGYHVGMTYDHDNHYTNFGRGNAGRLVIMAPALTQPDLFYAMKHMHFYGSDDWNAKIDFKIGSSMMGDTTSGNPNPTINIIHNDGDGELADSIKIWSGAVGSAFDPTVVAYVTASNTFMYTDNSLTLLTPQYYFIEIVQTDGQRIITSPIWYTKRNSIGIKELEKEISFIMFPNPTSSKLNISTGICASYKVELFDVSGKKVYEQKFNEPDITIVTQNFAPGYYNLKITSGIASNTKKLIIE